ncbi:FeoB-associated Cys-rich membrane protein [Pedobacter deserti]|nr:FeoB-associated Cys-rich membrane protein [Pedobacter sp. SYSU D00382]
MDFQVVLAGLLFVAALFYIGRLVYRSVSPKRNGCGSNCKCGVDFSNIKP